MTVERKDLDLSLSLSFTAAENRSSLQLNLMPSLVVSSSPPVAAFSPHKISWTTGPFPASPSDRNSEPFKASESTRSFLKGIDVNRLPSSADCDDEAGVSSPNSTISSLSGKRSEREPTGDDNDNDNDNDNDAERACSRGISDEEDGDNSRKKLRLSKDQSAILEESFKEHNTLNPKQKLALAKRLGLRPRQVEVWFQNRRARTKLKQTEVDCEFLRRLCENLTEENRRLQKEVQELRALKLSPQLYMEMTPPTTLTMCPSCERVAVPPSSAHAPQPPHAPLDHPHPHHHHHRPMPINPWAAVPQRPFDLGGLDRKSLLGPRA